MENNLSSSFIVGGGAVKALGAGRVGGYLVLFGTKETADLGRQWFTKNTNYDLERSDAVSVHYDHGMDASLGVKKIGAGKMAIDDIGVWIEAQLEQRDSYEKAIYQLAKKGKLGWSSGSLPQLVSVKNADGKIIEGETACVTPGEITNWPLGLDATLTPTPCDPRNNAIALKSWKRGAALKDMMDGLEEEGEPTADNLFDAALEEQLEPSFWQLQSALCCAVTNLHAAWLTGGVTDAEIGTKVNEILAAFVAAAAPVIADDVTEEAQIVLYGKSVSLAKITSPVTRTFASEMNAARDAVKSLGARARSILSLRAVKEGRTFSQANTEKIVTTAETIRDEANALITLVSEKAAGKSAPESIALQFEYERERARSLELV